MKEKWILGSLIALWVLFVGWSLYEVGKEVERAAWCDAVQGTIVDSTCLRKGIVIDPRHLQK